MTGIAVYWHFVIGPEAEDEEVTTIESGIEKAVSEEDKANQREADTGTGPTGDITIPDVRPDDAIFIPLGWARQCPRTFYKGSDPEWQSFVEFAKDKRRSLLIRSMPHVSVLKLFHQH